MQLSDVILNTDALSLCRQLPDQSIDLILTDPPYGVTKIGWDNVVDVNEMMSEFRRIIKPRRAIVITSIQPFSSFLVVAAAEIFRYEWVLKKHQATRWLDAKRRPLQAHETALVFGVGGHPEYWPQMTAGEAYTTIRSGNDSIYAEGRTNTTSDGFRYPQSVLMVKVPSPAERLHPTQKAQGVFQYFIRTYSKPGDLVLDPFCGSGTTAAAAKAEGRHYLTCDTDPHYVQVATERLAEQDINPTLPQNGVKQLDLFASRETEEIP